MAFVLPSLRFSNEVGHAWNDNETSNEVKDACQPIDSDHIRSSAIMPSSPLLPSFSASDTFAAAADSSPELKDANCSGTDEDHTNNDERKECDNLQGELPVMGGNSATACQLTSTADQNAAPSSSPASSSIGSKKRPRREQSPLSNDTPVSSPTSSDGSLQEQEVPSEHVSDDDDSMNAFDDDDVITAFDAHPLWLTMAIICMMHAFGLLVSRMLPALHLSQELVTSLSWMLVASGPIRQQLQHDHSSYVKAPRRERQRRERSLASAIFLGAMAIVYTAAERLFRRFAHVDTDPTTLVPFLVAWMLQTMLACAVALPHAVGMSTSGRRESVHRWSLHLGMAVATAGLALYMVSLYQQWQCQKYSHALHGLESDAAIHSFGGGGDYCYRDLFAYAQRPDYSALVLTVLGMAVIHGAPSKGSKQVGRNEASNEDLTGERCHAFWRWPLFAALGVIGPPLLMAWLLQMTHSIQTTMGSEAVYGLDLVATAYMDIVPLFLYPTCRNWMEHSHDNALFQPSLPFAPEPYQRMAAIGLDAVSRQELQQYATRGIWAILETTASSDRSYGGYTPHDHESAKVKHHDLPRRKQRPRRHARQIHSSYRMDPESETRRNSEAYVNDDAEAVEKEAKQSRGASSATVEATSTGRYDLKSCIDSPDAGSNELTTRIPSFAVNEDSASVGRATFNSSATIKAPLTKSALRQLACIERAAAALDDETEDSNAILSSAVRGLVRRLSMIPTKKSSSDVRAHLDTGAMRLSQRHAPTEGYSLQNVTRPASIAELLRVERLVDLTITDVDRLFAHDVNGHRNFHNVFKGWIHKTMDHVEPPRFQRHNELWMLDFDVSQ